MPPRASRELPPALQTRQSNKDKVVGGPDMPKPRKKPEEVAQEKAAKTAAKEQAHLQKKTALQRVEDLKAGLGEDAPTLSRATRAASKARPSVISSGTENESSASNVVGKDAQIQPRLVPQSRESRVSETQADQDEDTADLEEHELRDEAGSPAPGDDDYVPADDPEGESEASSMEVDEEEERRPDKRKQKAKAGEKKRASTRGMGKRKHDELGESETLTAPKTGKKAKAANARASAGKSSALVANWTDLLEPQHPERSPSPSSEIPDVPTPAGSRPSSRLSTASSVPPSTAGDTTDSDGLGLDEGEGAIDEDAVTYPKPNVTQHRVPFRVNDVRDALRYREAQQVELAATIVKPSIGGSAQTGGAASAASLATATSASRLLPEIAHPLTKVARKVSAPGGDKNPGPKGDVAITAPKKKRHRRNAGAEDAKSKPTINDLPPVMQRPFATRFMPIARQFAGTLEPWADIKFTELQVIHRRAFGNLADLHPLEEDDKCHKLIQSKISDWRAKFALTSMETWKEILVDPDMKAVFTSTEGVGKYAEFLLGDGQTAAPFFWREWNKGEKKIGRLQGELIIGSLASHIAEMVNVPHGERNQEMPRGALGMATLAAMHTLSHYTTGQWKPPAGRAGWFSGDNYSDSIVFVDGRNKNNKKLTRIMKVIDALDANEWLEILDAARAVMVRRQTAPGKRTKSGQGAVAAADPAADGAESDDSDLMLVADA